MVALLTALALAARAGGKAVVTHRREVASFPDWIATDLERLYRVEGERLELTMSTAAAERGVATVAWEPVT